MLVDFRRYGVDGEVISDMQVFYVMSLQDGRWGMQYRSGGPKPGQFPGEPARTGRGCGGGGAPRILRRLQRR